MSDATQVFGLVVLLVIGVTWAAAWCVVQVAKSTAAKVKRR